MNILRVIPESDVVYRLGWTLLHSLWLGIGVAAVLALGLLILRRRSANARYLASCAAMLALIAGTIVTFVVVPAPVRPPAPAATAAETPRTHALLPPADGFVAAPTPAAEDQPLPPSPAVRLAPTPAPAGPAAAPKRSPAARAAEVLEPAMPWLVLVWAVGVFVMSVRDISAWMAATGIRRSATLPVEPAVIEAVARLAGLMRLRRPVRVLQSAVVKVPTVIGWLCPVILLPGSLATGLSTYQLEAILLHELAHIRRLDYLVNLLQRLAETLLFYHPAVWFISRHIRAERENCCDDVVIDACGDRALYAEALVAVAGRRRPRLAVAAAEGKLLPRVRRILGLSDDAGLGARWLAGVLTMTGLAIAGAIIYGCAAGAAGQEAPPASRAAARPDSPQAQPAVKVKPVGREVNNPDEVLATMLAEANANVARLQQGSIRALGTFSQFDEGGGPKTPFRVEAFAAYKPGKLRLDHKQGEEAWCRSFVTAEGYYRHRTTPSDRRGFLRDRRASEMMHPYSGFLPSRNSAFWRRYLEAAMRKSGKAALSRVARAVLNGTDVYVVTYVLKSQPKNLFRYYVDPKLGCAVVRREYYHDSGKGRVLRREDRCEMQPTRLGGWYLKRCSERGYRPDGTIRTATVWEVRDFNFQAEVPEETFTWEAIGIFPGMTIHDMRLGIYYKYKGPAGKEGPTPPGRDLGLRQIPEQARQVLEAVAAARSDREYWARRYAMINRPAPDLDVAEWVQSGPLRLADLRGKVVILEFWALGCGPCTDGGEFNKRYEAGAPDSVVMIGVHPPLDDADEVRRGIAKYKIKYPVCIDKGGGGRMFNDGSTYARYGVSGLGSTALIDVRGRVRSVTTPADPLMLKTLIKEAATGVVGSTPADHGDYLFGMHYAPKELIFGRLPAGQAAQGSMFLYKPDDPTFSVKLAAAPKSPLRVNLLTWTLEGQSLHELKVSLGPAATPGEYKAELVITTSEERKPRIVIPVTATVQAGSQDK